MDNCDAAELENEPWYALMVRPRFERTVEQNLLGRGVECYLPLYRSIRRWSDRTKELELPLFPRYLFCRLDIDRRLPVLQTPGVISFVGVGRIPAPVPGKEIAAIRAAADRGRGTSPWPNLEVGDRVVVATGSLAGVEGVLIQFRGSHRLVINVPVLQRSVATVVDRSAVMLLDGRPHRPVMAAGSDRVRVLTDRGQRVALLP